MIIKGANKLPVEDLREIAKFNRIVRNYLKMLKIEKREYDKSRKEGH